jgi:hypothetical protein
MALPSPASAKAWLGQNAFVCSLCAACRLTLLHRLLRPATRHSRKPAKPALSKHAQTSVGKKEEGVEGWLHTTSEPNVVSSRTI